MIKNLRLSHFKNFKEASLSLGVFTVLIGANASGKSNIRDAFRFLHGIGNGYSVAETLGQKFVGGELVWEGIRGGMREVAYHGSDRFNLKIDFVVSENVSYPEIENSLISYNLSVGPPRHGARHGYSLDESMRIDDALVFEVRGTGARNKVISRTGLDDRGPYTWPLDYSELLLGQPVYSLAEGGRGPGALINITRLTLQPFRFFDLSPTQLRIPSLPGQVDLGDRGENLSSVLFAICEDPSQKEALLEWVRRLTPMDVDDLEFDSDAAGRVLLRLKERDGRSISAISASDGTLRFLAILAALFGPNPASFYFIEEIENGIHPTRLGLLVELIESQTKRRNIQVVATTHAPLLLQFLNEESLANASVVYRLPDHPDARIKRIVDVPDAIRVIKEQGISLLHASSWFEDVLNFADEEERPTHPETDDAPLMPTEGATR